MRKKCIAGSVTVEASLSLTLFILGYLAVLSMAFAVRTESAVQCALDRTAAKISGYCYAAERLSVSEYMEQAGVSVSEAIEKIGVFSAAGCRSGQETDEPSGYLHDLAEVFTDGASVSGIAGEPVYRAIFAECLAGSREDADKYLNTLAGITSDDIDLHFSDVLKDGKTIEMVAVYKIKLHTFGLFGNKGMSLTMKNTAVTSAWTTGEKRDSGETPSKWRLPSFERGKAWVAEIKSEHSMDAVKSGKGIDLYKLGKYTMICSLNVFASTYSECAVPGSRNASDYSVNEAAVEKVIGGYAAKLAECIWNRSSSLQFENGVHVPDNPENKRAELIIVVPAEAGETENIRSALNTVAETIRRENSAEVIYEYRERALY